MRTIIKMLRTAAVVVALCTHPSIGSAQMPQRGNFLLLNNGGIVQGDIRRDGDKYIVASGASQMGLPIDMVSAVTQERGELYAAMRNRTNLRDADDLMNLAQWSLSNGFYKEAKSDLAVVLKSGRSERTIRSMLQQIERLEREAKTEEKLVDKPKKFTPLSDKPPVDFNPESRLQFAQRVMPALCNMCIECHNSQHRGDFQLMAADGPGDRTAVQHNLLMSLKHLDRNDRAESPLLAMGVTPHGGLKKAPFRDRNAPGFRTIAEWAEIALLNSVREANPSPPKVRDTVKEEQPRTNPNSPGFAVDQKPNRNSEPSGGFGSERKDTSKEDSQTNSQPNPKKDDYDPNVFDLERRPISTNERPNSSVPQKTPLTVLDPNLPPPSDQVGETTPWGQLTPGAKGPVVTPTPGPELSPPRIVNREFRPTPPKAPNSNPLPQAPPSR